MSNSTVIDALAALSHSSSQGDYGITKLPRAALMTPEEDKLQNDDLVEQHTKNLTSPKATTSVNKIKKKLSGSK